MPRGYAFPGYVEPGYVDLETPVTVSIPAGEVVTAATSFGDPGAPATLYDQSTGPYADEIMFGFQFQSGLYLYGTKVPSAAIVADAMDRQATVLEYSDLVISTAPTGHDLIASIGASEIPRGDVTLDNTHLEWSMRLAREPVLLQSVSIWAYYGGEQLRKLFTAQITAVELQGSRIRLEYGEP